MDLAAFASSPVGQLVPITGLDGRYAETFETCACLPDPLPPTVALDPETVFAVTTATAAVARLDQAAFRLPNPMLLARPAIRREAVSTSALEGTYATFDEVLESDFLEASDLTPALAEVRNYVVAAEKAFEWITERPITVGLLEDLQKDLLQGTRGETADAGRIRQIQVCIGNDAGRVTDAHFIPPPPGNQLRDGIQAWQQWISADDPVPTVVKMALGHYQFETLHPFNDGNGRLGRLICVLQLAHRKELRVPVLNLSPWFEQRRREYHDGLLHTSMTGDFDPWIRFFCSAVETQARQAVDRIDALLDWKETTLARLREAKLRGIATTIVDELIGYPMLTPTTASRLYNVSYPAANTAIQRLSALGILHERTGRRYARVYEARDVLRIINN